MFASRGYLWGGVPATLASFALTQYFQAVFGTNALGTGLRLDPVLIDSFVNQPAELAPIAAMCRAIEEVFGELSQEGAALERASQRLILSVPELRARLFEQMTSGLEMVEDAVARRVGRSPGDFAVRPWSGAVVGIIRSVYFAALDGPVHLMTEIGRGLAQLEAGLPL